MWAEVEKIRCLISIYLRTLFVHKRLFVCALFSGFCCIAVLLGAAVVFGPTNQYDDFTSELYCQWLFEEPVDYAALAERLNEDWVNGYIAEIHALTKLNTESGSILVYGLSEEVFRAKDEITYGNIDYSKETTHCYIDQGLIPYEYDIKLDELTIVFNGVIFDRIGKTYLLPYNYPENIIDQIESNESLTITCLQNPNMRFFSNADILYENVSGDQGRASVYVPLEFMQEQHIHVSAIVLTMKKPLSNETRKAFEDYFAEFRLRTFEHPELANWSRLTNEMVENTIKEMWAVESIMFVCLLNQLVFWEMLVDRLKPVMRRVRTIGLSKITHNTALMALFSLIVVLIACVAFPLGVWIMKVISTQISLSIQSVVCASAIWIIGMVSYCMIVAQHRSGR